MLHPDYFHGTEQDRAELSDQLALIYNRMPRSALFGHIAHAVLYQFFGATEVTPFKSRIREGEDAPRETIHTLRYQGYSNVVARGAYDINTDAGPQLFDLEAPKGQVKLHIPHTNLIEDKTSVAVDVDRSTLRLRTRNLGEHKVRTLSVGTHLLLEATHVANGIPFTEDPYELEDYRQTATLHEEFAVFAEGLRDTHPKEFNTPEQEEPFLRIQELARQRPGC